MIRPGKAGVDQLRLPSSSPDTTRRGIAPAYVDKVGREGVRVGDLLRPTTAVRDSLAGKIRRNNTTIPAMPAMITSNHQLVIR